jgi:benzil reductase ((S)-benzoin forming)
MPTPLLAPHKAALVTGATQGIGFALTTNLLRHGWTVFGTGRNTEKLEETKKRFQNFVPIPADLTRNIDIQRVADTIEITQLPLMISVQNAGMKTPPRPLEQHSCEVIDEVMGLNLLAPMKLTALLTKFMPPEARLLYVTSRAAKLQLKESSTYCASKAGLDEIAAIMRKELHDKNIGVSCVIPGEVDTHIQKTLRETKSFHLHRMFQKAHESGQLISPEVCADFLKFLLCDLPFKEFKESKMPVSIYDDWHKEFWLKSPSQLPAFPF